MLVSTIKPVSFKGQIIDAHGHIGTFEKGGPSFNVSHLDKFVKQPLPNGDTVEKIIVSNLDCMIGGGTLDEYSGNMNTLLMCQNSPKYSPLAVCMPHKGSVENIEKLLNNNPNGFIGLKFHPDCYGIKASDDLYLPYLKLAEKHKLPCLFHSAVNVDNQNGGKLFKLDDGTIDRTKLSLSDPEFIYESAKKVKNTPVIMAHMGAGWNESHDRAIDILVESIKKGDANLYADVSWVDIDAGNKNHILKAIKELKKLGKTDRLLFGSDVPIDRFSQKDARDLYSNFVEDIKTAIRNDVELKDESEEIIDKLFKKNAQELFYDRNWAKIAIENVENTVKNKTNETVEAVKNSKFKKFVPVIAAIGLVIMSAIVLYKKLLHKSSIAPQKANLNMPTVNINEFAAKCQNLSKS